MPVSAKYQADTMSDLQAVAPVTSRRMFGGVGLYCDGIFFALMDNDKLYFKVNDSNREEYEAAGMGMFHPYGDERTMPYYEVPPSTIENPTDLRAWIDKAVAVASAKKKK